MRLGASRAILQSYNRAIPQSYNRAIVQSCRNDPSLLSYRLYTTLLGYLLRLDRKDFPLRN